MAKNEKITLGELKKQLESTDGKEIPTHLALTNSGAKVVVQKVFGEGNVLAVYSNGFALYRNEKRYTIFRVDQCGGYTYFMRTEDLFYDESYFDYQNWWVRLVLEGEDRLLHNIKAREASFLIGRYSPIGRKKIRVIPDEDVLDTYIRHEEIQSWFNSLPQKQKLYFYLRYVEGYSVHEISQQTGVFFTVIYRSLRVVRKKIIKNILEQG